MYVYIHMYICAYNLYIIVTMFEATRDSRNLPSCCAIGGGGCGDSCGWFA